MLKITSTTKTESIEVLPDSPKLTLEMRRCRHFEKPDTSWRELFLRVEGTVSEKGISWPEGWDFLITTDDAKVIGAACAQMSYYLDNDQSESVNMIQATFVVLPWLEICSTSKDKNWVGHFKFFKDGRSMTAQFNTIAPFSVLQRWAAVISR